MLGLLANSGTKLWPAAACRHQGRKNSPSSAENGEIEPTKGNGERKES